jgi:hypothetical protein
MSSPFYVIIQFGKRNPSPLERGWGEVLSNITGHAINISKSLQKKSNSCIIYFMRYSNDE